MITKKHQYTDAGLIKCLFQDLRNDGLTDQAMILFKNRHNVKLDKFGWPYLKLKGDLMFDESNTTA